MRETTFRTIFAVLGFVFELLLLADFTARLWRPELELRWGWVVYSLFAVGGLVVGILFVASGAPVKLTIAPFLLVVWACFGLVVPYTVLYVVHTALNVASHFVDRGG